MKSLIAIIGSLVVLFIAGSIFMMTKDTVEAPEVACTMEARICPDGSAVGRTGPNCSFAPCPELPATEDDMIVITEPSAGAKLTSPARVSGYARGNWFFEASAPVSVVNWDGLIIGEGYVTAEGNWMTTEFVPFSGTISYTIDPNTPYDRGTIIFKKDNPSGLPEHDDAREIPVTFSELSETSAPAPSDDDEMVFCTMDAMQCPDGSYVGRVAPSCAFAPCPGPGSTIEVQ